MCLVDRERNCEGCGEGCDLGGEIQIRDYVNGMISWDSISCKVDIMIKYEGVRIGQNQSFS